MMEMNVRLLHTVMHW